MIVVTPALDAPVAGAVRALLEAAFDGDFTDHDWAHALGGLHTVVFEMGEPIAHGSVVERTLWHGGGPLRAGYVEAVAVRADRRGRGHGTAVMDALESLVRDRYELGALSSTERGRRFYAARGWQPWRGPTSVRAPTGDVRTPDDDGGVLVLPVAAELDLDGALTCDWREGEVW